jgi:hypothetical protein
VVVSNFYDVRYDELCNFEDVDNIIWTWIFFGKIPGQEGQFVVLQLTLPYSFGAACGHQFQG